MASPGIKGKLTSLELNKLADIVGRHHDGHGLHLQVTRPGVASWVQRYTSPVTGRERNMGLGPLRLVGLAEARTKSLEIQLQVYKGVDPLDVPIVEEPAIEDGKGVHLYRHFDKDGRLLYVGVSLSAVRRLGEHRENSKWFKSIRKVTVELFPTMALAIAAETRAIQVEKPSFNIRGSSKKSKKLTKSARILMELGKHDLEITTHRADHGFDQGGVPTHGPAAHHDLQADAAAQADDEEGREAAADLLQIGDRVSAASPAASTAEAARETTED